MRMTKKFKIIALIIIFLSVFLNVFLLSCFFKNIIGPLFNTALNIFDYKLIKIFVYIFQGILFMIGIFMFFRPYFFIDRRIFFRNLFISILLFFFFLFVIELINFFIIINKGNYYVWQPNLHRTFYSPPGILPGIEGITYFTINKFGYRGEVFENKSNEYRILTIGGSTTECLFLNDSQAWPFLLENMLNKTNEDKKVIVMNAGKSGLDTREHILQIKHLSDQYNPDLIIFLIGVNDVSFRIRYGADWHPLPLDYSRAFMVSPKYCLRDMLFYRIFKIFWGVIIREVPQDPVQYNELRNRQLQSPEKIDEVPYFDDGLEYSSSNIEQIINISKDKKVKVLFLTQPHLWKENISDSENNLLVNYQTIKGEYYSVRVMDILMDAYNKRLLDICRNDDLLCFDLDSKIPKNISVFYDDVHFNVNGSLKVAGEISSFIKENFVEFSE